MSNDRLSIDTKNNRKVNLGNYGTPDVCRNFYWIASIDAWDYCDSKPLAEMVVNHAVPVELRHVLASIVSGERKQNKRGAAKLKIDADQRMLVAASFLSLLQIPEGVLGKRTQPSYFEIADEKGIEYIDLHRKYERYVKTMYSRIACAAGVSVETLENLLRELKEKINKYPNI